MWGFPRGSAERAGAGLPGAGEGEKGGIGSRESCKGVQADGVVMQCLGKRQSMLGRLLGGTVGNPGAVLRTGRESEGEKIPGGRSGARILARDGH